MDVSVRYIGGTICLLLLLVFWVLSAEVLQGLGDPTSKYYYDKAYFERYVITSGYGVFLIPFLLVQLYISFKCKNTAKQFALQIIKPEHRYIAFCSFFYAFLYLSFGWLWYLSLAHTSVSANTIIYDCSFVIIFICSIFVLNERVSIVKVSSILFCLVGVVIVCVSSLSSSSNSAVEQTVGGYIELVLSTIGYSIFQVIFKKLSREQTSDVQIRTSSNSFKHTSNLQEEDDTTDLSTVVIIRKEIFFLSDTFLVLGMLGLWAFVCYWPGVIILDLLHLEEFQWPSMDAWEMIGFTITLDAGINFCLLTGILLTNPVFISVGSLLSIPVSMFFDIVIHQYILPPVAFLGVLLIVLGFALINIGDYLLKHRIPRVAATLVPSSDEFTKTYIKGMNENIVYYLLSCSIGWKNNIIFPVYHDTISERVPID